MKTDIALIDSNYLCHYNAHKFGDFEYEGQRCGVIFGFMHSLISIAKELSPDMFVFVWDSKSSFRRDVYPSYKESRRKGRTELTREERIERRLNYMQFDTIRDWVLPTLGFRNIFMFDGYEGDDIIAAITNSFGSDNTIVIVSTDNDLYQLLSPSCFMYNPRTRKIYTDSDFLDEYGISPTSWCAAKALAGCGTDNVKGIPGVGIKKAITYLKGELPDGKILQKIDSDEGQARLFENFPLVCLPFPGCPQVTELSVDELTLDGFFEVCDRYGFRSIVAKEMLWRELFGVS